MDKRSGIPIGITIGSILCTILFLFVIDPKERSREQSVKSGHAEWYIDGNEKKWRWKECSTCAPIKIQEK